MLLCPLTKFNLDNYIDIIITSSMNHLKIDHHIKLYFLNICEGWLHCFKNVDKYLFFKLSIVLKSSLNINIRIHHSNYRKRI